ncbi:DUF6785 family protein [Candidatus Poribacteria bacterium]
MSENSVLSSQKETDRISWRAILIGLLLIPVNTYWIAMTEMVWKSLHFTVSSLPMNVVFILLFLILLNWLVRSITPRFALSPSELLTVYIMLAASSTITGYDSMVALMGVIPHAFWHDTLENDWAALFHNNIPKWLVVSDRKIARGFYQGEEAFFITKNVNSWLNPILTWSAFIVLLVLIMLFINVLIRKQWTEREKLSYPIIQLPLEMTSEKTRLFRNKLMWIGFSIAAVLDILTGLNYLYPSVPHIPTRGIDLQNIFTDKPFNAIGFSPIRFRPFIIGLTYLLPWDLSFSCWFFFILRKSFRIWSSAVGWLNMPGFPFFGEQALGGLIGLSIIALASNWRYLGNVFARIFSSKGEDDSREPMKYRTAAIGVVIASIFLLVFCIRAEMSPWVFFIFFGIYFAMSLALTRIRAEVGIPEHAFFLVTPRDAMVTVLGTRRLGKRNLTILSLFVWFNKRNRNNPMPHQLEAFKIAERARISSRGVLWTMLIASVAGITSAFIIFPYAIYKYGAEARASGVLEIGREAFEKLASWLHYPRESDLLGSVFSAGGMVFTFFLALMRRKFIWWPFHPAGYPLGTGFGIDDYWFTMIISSTIKLVVLRHGGARSYRRSIPFFLGLILGEYTIACGWALLGVIVGRPMYEVWV